MEMNGNETSSCHFSLYNGLVAFTHLKLDLHRDSILLSNSTTTNLVQSVLELVEVKIYENPKPPMFGWQNIDLTNLVILLMLAPSKTCRRSERTR